MSDSCPVEVTIAPLTEVRGSKRLRYVTTATLDIGGVVIELQGICVVEEHRGRLTVLMPQTKHHSNGMNYPAIVVPPELHRCIEQETLSLLPGRRTIISYPERAP